MKKFFLSVLFICSCFILARSTNGDVFDFGTLKYEVLNEDCKTCQLCGVASTFVFPTSNNSYVGFYIPAIANGYSVVKIKERAFYYTNTRKISSINIAEGIQQIGDYAFYNCSKLTDIKIPSSVNSIGTKAFSLCSSLKNVVFSEGNDSIESEAFSSCPITSLSIPSSVNYIGSNAFSTGSLQSITVDLSNNTYDSRSGCNAIVESATNKLLLGCSETIIPNSITSIGDYAFSGCGALSTLSIPNSVVDIGTFAFSGCSNVKSISISKNVQHIGSSAFNSCKKVEKVYINDLTSWCSINFEDKLSVPFNSSVKLYVDNIEVVDLAIPESVTRIGQYAFYNLSTPSSLTIPKSITHIGKSAFGMDNYGINKLIIDDLESWCNIEFDDANSNPMISNPLIYIEGKEQLDVQIPNTVTKINSFAFYSARIKSIRIPKTVEKIGHDAFSNSNYLKFISSEIITPFSVENLPTHTLFDGEDVKLFVPIGTKEKYELAEGWNKIADIVEGEYIWNEKDGTTFSVAVTDSTELEFVIINESDKSCKLRKCTASGNVVLPSSVNGYNVTRIGNGIYKADTLTIPEGVVSIEYNAHLNSIINVILPQTLKSIGAFAFNGGKLGRLHVPGSVTSIGSNAFKNCKIKELILDEGIRDIGEYAFYGNSIVNLKIPSSITTIQPFVFSFNNITTLELPNTLKVIRRDAFCCNSFRNIIIPEGVDSICDRSFFHCTSAETVVLPSTLKFIGGDAFTVDGTLSNNNVPSYKSIYSYIKYPFSVSTIFNCWSNSDRENADDYIYNTATLYVPKGSKSLYESITTWNYFTLIEELDGIALGDINKDGDVNISDIVSLVNAVLNPSNSIDEDINNDGEVNISDVVILVNLILNK